MPIIIIVLMVTVVVIALSIAKRQMDNFYDELDQSELRWLTPGTCHYCGKELKSLTSYNCPHCGAPRK